MGTYYDLKRKAFEIIDGLYKRGSLIDDIKFYVETNFGFGEKFVEKRISDLKKRGFKVDAKKEEMKTNGT